MEEIKMGAKASKNEAISNLSAELRLLTKKIYNEHGEPIYFIPRAEEDDDKKELTVHDSTMKNKKIILFKVICEVTESPDDLEWKDLYKLMLESIIKYNTKDDAKSIVNTYLTS